MHSTANSSVIKTDGNSIITESRILKKKMGVEEMLKYCVHSKTLTNGLICPNCETESVEAICEKCSSAVNVTDSPCFTAINVHQLRTLDLSNSKLHIIPEVISILNNLVGLNLSRNLIRKVPESFNCLSKLRYLNLSHNCFSEVPECLTEGYLGVLLYLDFSYNSLKTFFIKETALQLLKSLDLSCNQLDTIPLWLIKNSYSSVKNLDLSNNCRDLLKNLTNIEIINDMRLMKNSLTETLRSLRMANCSLSKLNIHILSVFKDLSVLNLSNNHISPSKSRENTLSEISLRLLPNFENVTELYLFNVHLYSLSEDIKSFLNLKVLDVSENELTQLPPELCSLKLLQCFFASKNFILALPDNFGNLMSLKRLYVSSNHLIGLPKSMTKLKCLEVLDLYDNYFEQVPHILQELNLNQLDMCYNYFHPKLISEERNSINLDYKQACHDLRSGLVKFPSRVDVRHDCQRPVSDNDSNYSDGSNDTTSILKKFRYRYPDDIASSEYSDEELISPAKNRFDLTVTEGNKETWNGSEENWDQDYDSDEYFDPNKVVIITNPAINTCFWSYNHKVPIWSGSGDINTYNPSHYHPRCMSSRRRQREFEVPAEGQFDDA